MSFSNLSFTQSFTLRGHSLTIVGKPGVWSWNRVNPGTAALLEVAEIAEADRVLDLGCGTGIIGAVAALEARQGEVILVDCNAAAVACTQATLKANNIHNAQVHLADGCSNLELGTFDRVLCHLPRERAVQEELLRGAAAVLRPGGSLYFVAHRQAGIRTAVTLVRDLLDRCGVIRQKKGYHVALAVRPPDREVPLPEPTYQAHAIRLDGVETTVVGKPGVFAWDRLDEGTRALVAAMEVSATDRVLDLGCGTGLAGVAAARRAAEGWVALVDVDLRAVEAARRTLAANDIPNAKVLLSDCGTDLAAGSFDAVITNPPFHQDVGVDRTAAQRFIHAAVRLLRPGGRLYLVANRFLTYEPWLNNAFARVNVAWEDNRFRVWEAHHPHG